MSEEVKSTTLNLLSERRARIIESGSERQGESTLVILKNGDLALYYSDMVTVSDLAEAKISRKISSDGGKTWSNREVVFAEAGMALFLPGIMRLDSGEIAITYARRVPGDWYADRVVRFSADEGKTWSDEIQINDNTYDYTTGAHDRFYKLSNGDLIILIHSMKSPGGHRPHHLVTDVYASSDQARTWKKMTEQSLDVPQNPHEEMEYGFWEASIAELQDGEILIVGRTATGWLYGCRSMDFGKTWPQPEKMGIRNPLAPPYLKVIPGTNTLIYMNNPIIFPERLSPGRAVFGDRFVLASQISEDGGRTWQNHKELEHHTTNWWYDYPHMVRQGNRMHLFYRAIELEVKGTRWGRVHIGYQQVPVSWFVE